MPHLADIFPEEPEATFDPAADILELIGNDQPGGGDTFGLETAETTLVYLIDWKKARSFIRWMIGFSHASAGAPYKMYRENPQPHPRFGWLTASTVHLAATAPVSNATDGVPERAPNVPAMYADTEITKTGLYQKCYATVRFVDQPWTFRPDGFVTTHKNEVERNCYFTPVPTQEMLSAEGGTAQLKWAQTSAAVVGPPAVAAGPTVGGVIANLFGTLVNKVTFTMNWMWVAESYLSLDPLLFYPRRILECVGHVNSTKFGPFPAGTVLMQPPKFTRFRFPVATFDGLDPFYGWNIQVPLTYFNPPRGVPRNAAVYPTQEAEDLIDGIPRGHRLMPWRTSLLWYEATREDNATHLLPETDLNQMFRHISDPA